MIPKVSWSREKNCWLQVCCFRGKNQHWWGYQQIVRAISHFWKSENQWKYHLVAAVEWLDEVSLKEDLCGLTEKCEMIICDSQGHPRVRNQLEPISRQLISEPVRHILVWLDIFCLWTHKFETIPCSRARGHTRSAACALIKAWRTCEMWYLRAAVLLTDYSSAELKRKLNILWLTQLHIVLLSTPVRHVRIKQVLEGLSEVSSHESVYSSLLHLSRAQPRAVGASFVATEMLMKPVRNSRAGKQPAEGCAS